MNSSGRMPLLIAIVGGSGSGKTWLAQRLQKLLSEKAALLSLDDFYFDRSNMPPSRREKINFDHPRSIDWKYFERVLQNCRSNVPSRIPQYEFTTHARVSFKENWQPKPVIIVEGLWLLHRPTTRRLFNLRIFIDCPEPLRLGRRVNRDVVERGRSPVSIKRQFTTTVAPMHKRFVAPQAGWADIVIGQPLAERDTDALADGIWGLLSANSIFPAWVRATFRAELFTLFKTQHSKP